MWAGPWNEAIQDHDVTSCSGTDLPLTWQVLIFCFLCDTQNALFSFSFFLTQLCNFMDGIHESINKIQILHNVDYQCSLVVI